MTSVYRICFWVGYSQVTLEKMKFYQGDISLKEPMNQSVWGVISKDSYEQKPNSYRVNFAWRKNDVRFLEMWASLYHFYNVAEK